MREALTAAGFDCPPSAGNFVVVRGPRTAPTSSRRRDSSSAGVAGRRSGSPSACRPRTTASSPRSAPAPAPSATRSALVVRTTAETALRIALTLDGQRPRPRRRPASASSTTCSRSSASTAGFDLEVVAGGDLDVDEHHTVEDVLAALGDALGQALDGREGVTRYGSATVPMDEARATAAVDLVRRPHAEVALAFAGDRVGGLALTLLPHALERFAMQAGLTLHVEAAGEDDHHVAEAAFKALGRALREACSPYGARQARRRGAVRSCSPTTAPGNLRSVARRFARAGADADVTADPDVVREAPLAVIAGVGNAEARRAGSRRAASPTRSASGSPPGRPVLGICVGMQLLFEESEEGGRGLGVLRGPVERLRAARVPHMGWNTLRVTAPDARCSTVSTARTSTSPTPSPARRPSRVAVAEVDHDGPVVAAVERGAVAGVQFHPERSGPAGARVLRNAVAWSRSA